MKKVLRSVLGLSILFGVTQGLKAQESKNDGYVLAKNVSGGEEDTLDLTNLSLEELMDISIVSASRYEEKSFNAPITSYVITRQEIVNAGAVNLPEALRLCPGVFVKQTTHGVYDISIRGFDNLPTYNYSNNNKTILVMINDRPVFDYFNGGTYWQNLPVDIVDIERIEIVYGPSSPLYGPNAVTGVINIITKAENKKLTVRAIEQAGVPATFISQGYVSGTIKEKLQLTGSYNYYAGVRSHKDYYEGSINGYVKTPGELTSQLGSEGIKQVFYNEDLALLKYSGNLSADLKLSPKVKINAGGGFNHSEALYAFSTLTGNSPFTNNSYFGTLRSEIHGFVVQASLLQGNQSLLGKIERYTYDYTNSDIYVDYNFKIGSNFSLRPALNYQKSLINDLPYTKNSPAPGIFNNKASIYNVAASLKADYRINKLRLIAALRGDKFQYPEEIYPAYQFVANYDINRNNIVRLNFARSNGGAFMADTYTDFVTFAMPPMGGQPGMRFTLEGNKDRKLLTNHLLELGYRARLGDNLQFDVSVFHQQAENYTFNINQDPSFDAPSNTIIVRSIYNNLDLKAIQDGVTLAANYITWKTKVHFKPFITYQKSMWKDYSPYYQTPGYNKDINNTVKEDKEGKTTPNIYGGFYLNVVPVDRLSINLSGYSFGKFEAYTLNSLSLQTGDVETTDDNNIKGKFVLNARVAFNVWKGISLSLNARNLTNADSREFFGTDKLGSLYLLGLNFNY